MEEEWAEERDDPEFWANQPQPINLWRSAAPCAWDTAAPLVPALRKCDVHFEESTPLFLPPDLLRRVLDTAVKLAARRAKKEAKARRLRTVESNSEVAERLSDAADDRPCNGVDSGESATVKRKAERKGERKATRKAARKEADRLEAERKAVRKAERRAKKRESRGDRGHVCVISRP